MKFASLPFFLLLLLEAAVAGSFATADDGCVRFDIPSAIPSWDVTDEETLLDGQRLVQISIPVSVLSDCQSDQSVLEMMIQVRGLGAGLQVDDYAPRTRLYSEIDGPITVEQREERKSSIGLDATGTVAEAIRLNADAGTSNVNGSLQRYQRIPEQKLLLASGTIQRGKGVYFKFRHSPQTTLEGGHELVLTLQVPSTWRGGMLRMDCVATGTEKYLIGGGDFTAGKASFVVATWLKGDPDARQIVQQYSSLESRFRQFADSWQTRQRKKRQGDPIGQLLGYNQSSLPDGWSRRFMLYDTRSIQTQIKPHLPGPLQKTTDQFLASRQSVLALAR